MGLNILKKIAKKFLEMLGLLLELLLELVLPPLFASYHGLIRGREVPPYNYVINAYSRSSSSSSSSPSSFRDILAISLKMFRPHLAWPRVAFNEKSKKKS